jgi:NMD protein affecting ribosome stability and mRNA decay
MAIKVKKLIKKLKEKDQDAEVEFIIVKTNGIMICMDVNSSAKNMVDLLKLFNS